MSEIDYLIVGHVTLDLVDGRFIPGGTACYASLTARNLGCRVGLVTSAGSDMDAQTVLPGIVTEIVPSPVTATFENAYQKGHRQQRLHSLALPIEGSHIPPEWRHASIVHLAPVAQEVWPSVLEGLSNSSLVGATPQGWMRDWDPRGLVRQRRWWCAEGFLSRLSALILSEGDLAGNVKDLQRFAEAVPAVVLTLGPRGARLFHEGGSRAVEAFPAVEVDPTGAGDVFAAAFLIALHRTGDPLHSFQYANCAASFAVEAWGTAGVPRLEQVEERLRSKPWVGSLP